MPFPGSPTKVTNLAKATKVIHVNPLEAMEPASCKPATLDPEKSGIKERSPSSFFGRALTLRVVGNAIGASAYTLTRIREARSQ